MIKPFCINRAFGTRVIILLAIVCTALLNKGFSQAKSPDSTQKAKSATVEMIKSVKVVVTDIETGLPLDSAYVFTSSVQKGYTDKQGVVVFTNVFPNAIINVNYNGYVDQSKKVRPNVKLRLVKNDKGRQPDQGGINNGRFLRPAEHFSGSATTYSGDNLRQLNPVNILEAISIVDPAFIALRENSSGDDPNTLHNVLIRGPRNFPATASIATSPSATPPGVQIAPSAGDFIARQVMQPNTPLILLDGMQISLQQLVDMDIYRIEKVSILKDASATALYGSRAANGVLVVQTKLPSRGTMNVTYSGQVQVSVPDLRSYNLMDAAQKLAIEKEAGMYTNNDALYQQRLNRVENGVNTNWLKEPTQTGTGTRHSLRLDGGDDALRYGLDFGYNQLKGSMKGSERKNTNLGAYISAQSKSVTFSNYLSYNQTLAENSPYGSLADYALLNPYWSNTDTLNGNIPRLLEEYKVPGTAGDSSVYIYNPAYNSTLATTNTRNYNRLSNLTNFNWIIGGGFVFKAGIAITTNKDVSDIFLPPSHTAFVNYKPDQFFKRGLYSQTAGNFKAYENNLLLNYKRTQGLHYFYGTVGINGLSTESDATGVFVQGFTSDQIANIGFGSAYSNSKPTTGKVNTRLISGFANLSYSYDSRFQLDGTITRDGSSQFGSEQRYANYYSLSGSWNAHNERFISSLKFINLLRLKASYGSVGSTFYQSYLGNTTYNYYTNQQYILGGSTSENRGVGLGAFLTGYGNQNLESPRVNKQNLSIETSLFKNRLYFRFEQYRETSEKLVLPIVSPASTGFSNFRYYNNLGSIENKGVELSLQYAVISNQTKGIKWSIGANALHNTNSVLQTSDYLDALNNLSNSALTDQTRPQAQYRKGYSLSTIWAVPSLGIDPATGKEQFRKTDGTTTFNWDAADKVAAGDYMPSWQGSFGTNFTYKKASFGAWFYYLTNAQSYNQTLSDKVENANLNNNVDVRASVGRWKQPGDQAIYKALSLNGLVTNPTYVTTRFVENESSISSASLNFRYTWPNFGQKKIPLQNTSVCLVVNNSLRTNKVQQERGITFPFSTFYSFTFSTSFK